MSTIPFIVIALECIFYHSQTLLLLLRAYYLLIITAFLAYMANAVRKYGHWLHDNYADLEHKEVRQSLLVQAVFLLFYVFYVIGDNSVIYEYFVQANDVVLIVLLLWRAETLQALGNPALQTADSADASDATDAATLASTSNIGQLLGKYCEDAQLYLQHDITLTQLAEAIGTNRTYLSAYFSQEGTSYNAYINRLRIEHFVRIYREAVTTNRPFTAQMLAYESGFRSYSTFGIAFKRFMGQTVTSWTKALT